MFFTGYGRETLVSKRTRLSAYRHRGEVFIALTSYDPTRIQEMTATNTSWPFVCVRNRSPRMLIFFAAPVSMIYNSEPYKSLWWPPEFRAVPRARCPTEFEDINLLLRDNWRIFLGVVIRVFISVRIAPLQSVSIIPKILVRFMTRCGGPGDGALSGTPSLLFRGTVCEISYS